MAKAMELRAHRRRAWAAAAVLVVVTTATALAGTATAQDDGGTDGTTDTTAATGGADEAAGGLDPEVAALGSETFTANCVSCHQAGGVGLEGQFPPLVDNPNLVDEEYVRQTVLNGKTGQIEVQGVTYDGQMPAITTLSAEELDAVAAYVVAGFPTVEGAVEVDPAAGLADGSLPGMATLMSVAAILVALAIAGMVLYPRLVSETDRVHLTWPVAWLKTGVIVVAIVVGTVLIPNWVISTQTVADLDRNAQDLITVGLWGGALVVCLSLLWLAGRKHRI